MKMAGQYKVCPPVKILFHIGRVMRQKNLIGCGIRLSNPLFDSSLRHPGFLKMAVTFCRNLKPGKPQPAAAAKKLPGTVLQEMYPRTLKLCPVPGVYISVLLRPFFQPLLVISVGIIDRKLPRKLSHKRKRRRKRLSLLPYQHISSDKDQRRIYLFNLPEKPPVPFPVRLIVKVAQKYEPYVFSYPLKLF